MSTTDVGGAHRVELPVAYADTDAGQLGFSLSAPEHEPLARVDIELSGIGVSLRLLGASHQVIVDDGAHHLCETVACLPDVDSALPTSFQEPGYYFSSRVDEFDDAGLSAFVAELTERVAAHATRDLPALIGHFPGDPNAVTAIVAEPGGSSITWQTWHTYPQSGEVVVTTSSIDRGVTA